MIGTVFYQSRHMVNSVTCIHLSAGVLWWLVLPSDLVPSGEDLKIILINANKYIK